jgi:K+-transporting ATPase ATPase B chain
LGSRQAVAFLPASGVTEGQIADAAQLSSLADETPEGRSIVVLAKEKYGLRGREVAAHNAKFIPFSAYTKMSGVDLEGRQLRKGATDAIVMFVKAQGGRIPAEVTELSDKISRTGGTPLAVADRSVLLGIIHLKEHRLGGRGAHRAAPGDGHPLGDGHRRQPADGGRHRV